MKFVKVASYLFATGLVLSSCVTGKYVSKPTGENLVSQAPMKLKMCGTAQYTYYAYSNSAVEMYREKAKYKKKGDTVYMRARTYYGDSTEISKEYFPKYLVQDDSLISLEYENMVYVKK